MINAQNYFNKQMENNEFSQSYNDISEQVDIEWELERLKKQIQDNIEHNIIIKQLEKLQIFVHNSMFVINQELTNKSNL